MLLYTHLLLLFFFSVILALLLQVVIMSTFLRHFVPLSVCRPNGPSKRGPGSRWCHLGTCTGYLLIKAHSALLRDLLRQATRMRPLYNFSAGILLYLNPLASSGVTTPQQMPFVFPPRLRVTVSNNSSSSGSGSEAVERSKIVTAFTDTGSPFSFIRPRLAEELGLKWTQLGEMVTVTVSSVTGENITEVQLHVNPFDIGQFKFMSLYELDQISPLIGDDEGVLFLCQQVPQSSLPLPSEKESEILIGTDLLPSLLLMDDDSANQVVSLGTDNLCALQTRLGWVIQGTQRNEALYGSVCNWVVSIVPSFTDWGSLMAFLAFDLLFALFVFVYLY